MKKNNSKEFTTEQTISSSEKRDYNHSSNNIQRPGFKSIYQLSLEN